MSSSHLHRAFAVARPSTRSTKAVRTSIVRSVLRNARRSVATLSYPLEETQTPLDFKILDIFDAPSRLGESSKLLLRSASSKLASTPPQASITTSAPSVKSSPKIQPLPAPILFDGPSRPRHIAMSAFRTRRSRSMSSSAAMGLDSLPTSLPEPIIFDGPSRLRPYHRGTFAENSEGAFASAGLSLLGASSILGLIGYAYYEISRTSRKPRSLNH